MQNRHQQNKFRQKGNFVMISQTLREVRKHEETMGKMIKPEERPAFHLTPRTGWMNDPNGFSYYNGEYHMFYQYNPYATHWDTMHWGHAVSKDLLRWEYLPAALAPDKAYDRNGCFSGNAIELPGGRQLLMYTGVFRERQCDGKFCDVQTQCIAIGDGKDYEKYENNPVLGEKDLPKESSIADFRDPQLWQKEDGTYCSVIANASNDGDGQILLFTSKDGLQWEFDKVLVKNQQRFGKMWECPDFFSLDGRQVLLVSPQNMLPQGFEYHNGNGTMCLIGDFDEETNTFLEQHNQSIDYGIDFYAPQTTLTPDGRRIMIGWMQNWDTCNHHAPHQKWFGQMSLPRELSIKDSRLFQQPLRELEALRSNKVAYENVIVEGTTSFPGVRGRRCDIEMTLRPADIDNIYKKFAIRFAQNEEYYTSLSFRPYESILRIDRKFSGSRRGLIHQRRCLVNGGDGELKLRIVLDRFSVEVFINDGEQVMSAAFYTEQEADGISFFADGKVNMDLVKYALVSEG